MVMPAARREAVARLCSAFEVSERRACSVLEADRTSVRYRSMRPDEAAARARLRELASQRRRFGYRRLHLLLTREGLVMNHKKLRRLYREEGLQVRRFRGSPASCVSDNGTELTSMAILRWSQERQVEWHYIAPGKPQQNAFAELFIGQLRDEMLFSSLSQRARGFGHLEARLQHRQAAQRRRQSAAGGVRRTQRPRHATGRGAAPHRGLRAPSRCIAEPTRLKSTRYSTHRWMKEGAQVTGVRDPS